MPMIWPELAAALHPSDRPAPAGWARCYETKFAVARLLQPKRIFEIGVRAGYSALAFLRASPEAQYLGIDANRAADGGFLGAIDHARELLSQFDATILEMSSRDYANSGGINRSTPAYDLIHIDGDHSFAGCSFDLRLAERLGFCHLLVDDCMCIGDVRRACSEFAFRNKADLTQLVIDDGLNGVMLFSRA